MKKVRTLFIGVFAIAMILCMTACGSSVKETTKNASVQASDQAQNDAEQNTDSSHSDVLVVYFSATGTTRGVAERIASVTDADIYELLAAEPYTADDLNYKNAGSRTTLEQNDSDSRPEIGSKGISLKGYKTIYLGYPIWHGQAPRILSTFVEKYSFEGITVIPFCTSGSSGIGQSAVTLENQTGSGNWIQGERFDANISESELKSWVEGLHVVHRSNKKYSSVKK